ncbi:hypothetical protein [Pseudomonas phage LUZ7]|uniref:Uncharacterized protein n=1 Tax=Pseudomonas phage LUZ7 TaxID=655097 RepID=C8ZKI8_9CAUD|nr:hypothetical protein PP-LUZ7_gp089 [Pseudomonas phage LUZ7]CAZ66230.1 hypothetical protein [Pseudomonas phage LUZ7]
MTDYELLNCLAPYFFSRKNLGVLASKYNKEGHAKEVERLRNNAGYLLSAILKKYGIRYMKFRSLEDAFFNRI